MRRFWINICQTAAARVEQDCQTPNTGVKTQEAKKGGV